MKSDAIKRGTERAPHRSLLRALGCTDREMSQPFIGVINSYSEAIPVTLGCARSPMLSRPVFAWPAALRLNVALSVCAMGWP